MSGDGGRRFRTAKADASQNCKDWTVEDVLRDALDDVVAGIGLEEGDSFSGAVILIQAERTDSDGKTRTKTLRWYQGLNSAELYWLLSRERANTLQGAE
jgi:hypothetical protein